MEYVAIENREGACQRQGARLYMAPLENSPARSAERSCPDRTHGICQ